MVKYYICVVWEFVIRIDEKNILRGDIFYWKIAGYEKYDYICVLCNMFL